MGRTKYRTQMRKNNSHVCRTRHRSLREEELHHTYHHLHLLWPFVQGGHASWRGQQSGSQQWRGTGFMGRGMGSGPRAGFPFPAGVATSAAPIVTATGPDALFSAQTSYGGGYLAGGYTSATAMPVFLPGFAGDRFAQGHVSSRMPTPGEYFLPASLERGFIRSTDAQHYNPQRLDMGVGGEVRYYLGSAENYSPARVQPTVINPETEGGAVVHDVFETQAEQRFTSEPVVQHVAYPARRVQSGRVQSLQIDALPLVQSVDNMTLITAANQLSTAIGGLVLPEARPLTLGERMHLRGSRPMSGQFMQVPGSRVSSAGSYGLRDMFGGSPRTSRAF